MNGVCRLLQRSGCRVANVGYRLMTESPYPAALEDVLAAIDAVEDKLRPGQVEGGSPDEPIETPVVLLGASAGGFLAMTAGFRLGYPRVAAVVSLSGPSDFYPGRVRTRYGIDRSAEKDLLNHPLALADRGSPPVLAIHGDPDDLVPFSQSERIATRMGELGRPCELRRFDNASPGHGLWIDGDRPEPDLKPALASQVIDFVLRSAGPTRP